MSTSALSVAPGIHRIEVPTPFRVGPVNAYLIEDEPLTLVDSGPNAASSLDALELALAELGYGIADLQLLVITHQHVDHHGLTSTLVRRSAAEVAVLDVLAEPLAAWPAYPERNDELAERLMRRHGVPGDVATVLRSVARAQHGWGAPAEATRRLVPGESLELRDRSFQVLHAPGHSPSDTLLWERQDRVMLAGDHLLEHISSNPIIALPLTEPAATGAFEEQSRPRPLPGYLAALRRTQALDPALVLGGHGSPVRNAQMLIEQRLLFHERRAAKIHAMIAERRQTAHDMARSMWGDRALTQAFLTLCEILGHVDLLIEDGRVRELDDGEIVRLEA